MDAHQADNLGEPHPRCQTFAGNVSEGEDGSVSHVKDGTEVARNRTDGKGLTRNLIVATAEFSRSIQAVLDLCRLKQVPTQRLELASQSLRLSGRLQPTALV